VGGYEVDPAQLAASGKSVGAQGDALVAALAGVESALSGAGLMCGTDEAGLAFFLDYRKGSQAVVSAAESSVNAFRNVGYGVEVSAHNYACSEAASTIGGGRESIPVPAQPARYTASSMSGQSGPTVPQPGLWSVVQQFVGGSWPNGNPATMRAAADAWRALGTAISAASGEAAGCRAGMAGHDIPELVHITAALTTLTKATHDLGGQCQSLAASLDSFAGEVQSCQDAIRDLLHRLSVSGILEELGAIFSGHNPLDDLKQIGHDISAILHTLSRELDAFASAFQLLIDGMDGVIREFEVWDRKEFTHFFGDQVGNAMASGLNSYLDIEGGVAKSGLEVLQSVPTMLAHPVDTAKGMVTMGKDMAEVFTPLGLVDPKGAAAAGEHLANVAKGVVDYKDWSSDRPLVGLGDNLGNIAQVLIPGVGEAKAGLTAGKVGEEGAQVARAEGTVARGGLEALGETGGRQIAGQAGKIGKDLDGLSVTPAEVPKVADPAPGARPAEAGAAAGSNGAGKAPVDATARPASTEPASAASHGTGTEAPSGPHGPGEAAPGAGSPNGAGETPHASASAHTPTVDAGGAAAHEAPQPRETADVLSGGGHDSGHPESDPGSHGGGGAHSGAEDHGGIPHDAPHNPPHTGLLDPPLNHNIPGDLLPDFAEINNEYRLPSGEVDPDRLGEWAQRISDAYPAITKDGVEGVYEYTTEHYDGMNPYLRNVDPLNPQQQEILNAHSIDQMTDSQRSDWEARITRTDEGLSALPPYRADPDDVFSTTWRGLRAPDSLLDQFVEGRSFSDPAYLSTSIDSDIAEEFARGANATQTPTLLTVHGYDGVDVMQLSRYMRESEILFPRGSKFDVLSKVTGEDGILRIVVRQVLR